MLHIDGSLLVHHDWLYLHTSHLGTGRVGAMSRGWDETYLETVLAALIIWNLKWDHQTWYLGTGLVASRLWGPSIYDRGII
jgi:hypothetical protein